VHRVTVTARHGNRVQVQALEAVDGTPIIDVKAVLDAEDREAATAGPAGRAQPS